MATHGVSLAELIPEVEEALQGMFMTCLNQRKLNMLKGLIAHGLPVNKEIQVGSYGVTPLALAVASGKAPGATRFACRVIDCLVKAGADINLASSGAGHPLAMAAFDGLADISQHMINLGANINYQAERNGYSALHVAISEQRTSLARIHLENGADPNLQDIRGNIPLCYARTKSDIDFLLKHGADCRIKNYDHHLPEDVISKVEPQLGRWLAQYRTGMERAELAAVIPVAREGAGTRTSPRTRRM